MNIYFLKENLKNKKQNHKLHHCIDKNKDNILISNLPKNTFPKYLPNTVMTCFPTNIPKQFLNINYIEIWTIYFFTINRFKGLRIKRLNYKVTHPRSSFRQSWNTSFHGVGWVAGSDSSWARSRQGEGGVTCQGAGVGEGRIQSIKLGLLALSLSHSQHKALRYTTDSTWSYSVFTTSVISNLYSSVLNEEYVNTARLWAKEWFIQLVSENRPLMTWKVWFNFPPILPQVWKRRNQGLDLPVFLVHSSKRGWVQGPDGSSAEKLSDSVHFT